MKYFAFFCHTSRSNSVPLGPWYSFWGLPFSHAGGAARKWFRDSLSLSLSSQGHSNIHGSCLRQDHQVQGNWLSQKPLRTSATPHPGCVVSNSLCILPPKLLSHAHLLGKEIHRGAEVLCWNGTWAMFTRCPAAITVLHDEKLGASTQLSVTNSGLPIFPFTSKTYSLTDTMLLPHCGVYPDFLMTGGSPEGLLLQRCFICQPL